MPAPNHRIQRLRQYRRIAESAEGMVTQMERALEDPNLDPITRKNYEVRLPKARREAEETWQSYMEIKNNVQ